MDTFVDFIVMIGAFCFGTAIGMGLHKHKDRVLWGRKKVDSNAPAGLTRDLIRGFFSPLTVESLIVTGREFPIRIQADLQRALDGVFTSDAGLRHFCAVRKQHAYEGISFSGLVIGGRDPTVIVSPEYDEVDIGEAQPIRCLRNGLWLLEKDATRYGVFLEPSLKFGCQRTGARIQIITPNDARGTALAQDFLRRIEQAIQEARSYRGKVLSLEIDHRYTGQASGIMVHRLKQVQRHEVILPARTVDLLDRNVIRFAAQRHRLVTHGQSAKKGLLLYGPPGTGKTHTIHYLAGALEGHTTLLVTAEQIGALPEYMTLARLLQPSVVVIEDVDLIGRERTAMHSPCEEVMLNKLLNEMDGLKEDAEIFFLLTTNHPASLEAALTSRPGRIDQAIEFPLPDADGREKLVRLYSQGVQISDDLVRVTVERTQGVSGAFIKELMRRATQFNLERNGGGVLSLADVENALDEILVAGGSLNLKLLGGNASRAPGDGTGA